MINDATFTGTAQTIYDSLVGFEKAIKKTRTGALSQLFEKMAEGRRKSHHSLEQALADFGLPPVNSTSMKSDLHRTWLDIAAFAESDDRAAIGRVIEGENYLATQLERAIDECGDEDEAILSLLMEIRQEVSAAGEELRRMTEKTQVNR